MSSNSAFSSIEYLPTGPHSPPGLNMGGGSPLAALRQLCHDLLNTSLVFLSGEFLRQ